MIRGLYGMRTIWWQDYNMIKKLYEKETSDGKTE